MRILGFNDLSDEDRVYVEFMCSTGRITSVKLPSPSVPAYPSWRRAGVCHLCGAKTIQAMGVAVCSSCDWTSK